MEKLSSDSDYDLQDEHCVIRSILRGVGGADDAVKRSKVESHSRTSTSKVYM